jgi:hypothetical protein
MRSRLSVKMAATPILRTKYNETLTTNEAIGQRIAAPHPPRCSGGWRWSDPAPILNPWPNRSILRIYPVDFWTCGDSI